jgi:hypothetical protein
MKNARRSVLYLKEMGCFVLVDRYQAVDSKHTYTWRMHFNNKDSAAVFNKISNSQWHLSRPMASLGVYLFADVPVTSQIGKGYLHGPERDYVPGGVFEGFEGSSIELKAYNATVTNAVTYYSVLFPAKKGNTTPTVTFNNGRLLIGKTKLVFKSGLCTIEKLGDKQCINLW